MRSSPDQICIRYKLSCCHCQPWCWGPWRGRWGWRWRRWMNNEKTKNFVHGYRQEIVGGEDGWYAPSPDQNQSVWQVSFYASQILQPLAGHAWAHIKKQCCWTFSDQAHGAGPKVQGVVGTTKRICKQNILQMLFFRTTQPFMISKIISILAFFGLWPHKWQLY